MDRNTSGAYPNDIALLAPSEPIVLSDEVAPIRLDTEQSADSCFITGWGRTEGKFITGRGMTEGKFITG